MDRVRVVGETYIVGENHLPENHLDSGTGNHRQASRDPEDYMLHRPHRALLQWRSIHPFRGGFRTLSIPLGRHRS